MPRFNLSSDIGSQVPEDLGDPVDQQSPSVSSISNASFSKHLSCLSPDGRFVYSLFIDRNGYVFIEAHHLPLAGTTDEELDRDFPAVIRARLPRSVQSALTLDSAVELLCVEGDSMPRPPVDFDEMGPSLRCMLPLLCLYTRQDVFLLELAFSCPFANDGVVRGDVVSVTNPMESFLLGKSSSTKIVRVRPAPQRRMGYACLSPPGAIAMLVHDTIMNGYTLALYHGMGSNLVTAPLVFGLEQLHEEAGIVDFCFAQSNGLALLPSMSVHILKASGEVLGASPIVFDGAVVPRSVVRDAVDYIDQAIELQGDKDAARWRQMLPARRFFADVFEKRDDGQSNFLKAVVRAGGDIRNAALFPVQIQGPVVFPAPMEPDEAWNRALVIEPFFSRDLVGVAIAREKNNVEFAVVPVTALLPRFTYENDDDRLDIDNTLAELGVVVERIAVICDDDTDLPGSTKPLLSLVRDPVADNMIHFASSRGVISISTNVMRFISSTVPKYRNGEGDEVGFLSPSGRRPNETIRTSAWSSVDVSAGEENVCLVGATISGDAHLGHTLIVRMTNGRMAVVNLTESRYLHEKDSFTASNKDATKNSTADAALQSVEQTKPLHELLHPLVAKVNSGLSGMARVVGGSTAQANISAGTLATVLTVKERCEKEVMLPLKEMNGISSSRLKTAREMCKSQLAQLQTLQATIKSLDERTKSTIGQLEAAESNANLLAQRSGSLLQACQDLQPTLTQSEIEYFTLLKRLKAKCDEWEESFGKVRGLFESVVGALPTGRAASDFGVSQTEVANCHDLLKGQELMMDRSAESLKRTSSIVMDIAAATGLSAAGMSHGERQ